MMVNIEKLRADGEALSEAHDKATPGEWSIPHLSDDSIFCNCGYILHEGHAGSIATVSVDDGKRIADGGNDCPPINEAKANGVFIAITHNLNPGASMVAAADEIERLRGLVERAFMEGLARQNPSSFTMRKWQQSESKRELEAES